MARVSGFKPLALPRLGEREQPLSTSADLAPETLEAALAADAGFHLGHDVQSSRRDRLVTFDADVIDAPADPPPHAGARRESRRGRTLMAASFIALRV